MKFKQIFINKLQKAYFLLFYALQLKRDGDTNKFALKKVILFSSSILIFLLSKSEKESA